MLNFHSARILAFDGVQDYLQDRRQAVGDRYGQHQGEMGRRRAANLGVLLTELGGENSQNRNANMLAVLLAVFTNTTPSSNGFFSSINPFRNIGRSSRLASLIADRWIEGEIDSRHTPRGSVTSHVFSADALARATRNSDNDRSVVINEHYGYTYFDKTKGARDILKNMLNSPMFQNEKAAIIKSLPRLRNYLERNNQHNRLEARMELPFPVGVEDNVTNTLRASRQRNFL